jgi:predicted NBD/HSP70 family sugar kinase
MLSLKPTRASKPERNKRNVLLQALHRRGTASRLQLALALHISNSRVCELVDAMVGEGILQEEELTNGDRRGRRGVSVRLNPGRGQLIGFDMEAKRLRMVVTDFAGQVLWQRREPLRPPKDRAALIDQILGFIDQSMKEIGKQFHRPLAFGIAASGVIDSKRGSIIHYDVLPQANDLPLRELICRQIGDMPCVMENNIRAMTLAEWVGGAAQGLNTFACVAVRSGVGCGLVINNRLRGGNHGFCGEIGYMMLPTTSSGGASTWKNLQQTVSESALGIDIETDGFAKLSDAAAKRCGEVIASQLASLSTVLDPEAIVLAGGLMNPMGPVWPHVIQTFRHATFPELAERVQLLPARLGAFAAAQGVAHRALYELFPVAPSPA